MSEPKLELGAVWVHKASGRRFVANEIDGEIVSLLREDNLVVTVEAANLRSSFVPMPERGQLWKSKSDRTVVEVLGVQDGRVEWAAQVADVVSRTCCSATLADFVVTFEPMGDEHSADAAYQGYAKGSLGTLFDVSLDRSFSVSLVDEAVRERLSPGLSGWDELDAKLRDPIGPDALPPFTLRTPKPAEPSPCITCGAPATETYCDPCERYHAADFTEPALATVSDHEEECSLRITPNCTRWLGVGVLAAWWDDEKASCLACAEKKIRANDAADDDMWAGVEARRKAHGWVET